MTLFLGRGGNRLRGEGRQGVLRQGRCAGRATIVSATRTIRILKGVQPYKGTRYGRLAFQNNYTMSIVVPMCGTTNALDGYLSSIYKRGLARSFRIVYIGSNSASNSASVLDGCRGQCPRLIMVRRRGHNNTNTEGYKLRGTKKECLFFLSTSSFLPRKILRGLLSSTRRSNTRVIVKGATEYLASERVVIRPEARRDQRRGDL